MKESKENKKGRACFLGLQTQKRAHTIPPTAFAAARCTRAPACQVKAGSLVESVCAHKGASRLLTHTNTNKNTFDKTGQKKRGVGGAKSGKKTNTHAPKEKDKQAQTRSKVVISRRRCVKKKRDPKEQPRKVIKK